MKRVMQAALVAIFLLCGVALYNTPTRAQAIGNGSGPCQFFPMLPVGNGSDPCGAAWQTYNAPFPLVATPMPMATGSIQVSIPGSRTTPIMYPDPSVSFVGLACFPVLEGGPTFFAGCATWNIKTGAVGTVTPINTFGSGSSLNAHNDPGGGLLMGGSKFIVTSNAIAGDGANSCLTSTGLQGSAEHCQGANIGSTVGGGVALTDITAAGSYIHLPIQGISEVSAVGWRNTPTSNAPWVLVGGQAQFNNPAQSGSFSYIILHPNYDPTGQILNSLSADTINGSGGITTQDVLTTPLTSFFSGNQQIARNVHSDVVLFGTIGDTGAGTLTATIAAQGGGPGWTCQWSGGTGNAATDNAAYAAAWNSGATTGTGCSTVQNVIQVQVVNNTFACPAGVGSCLQWVRVSGYPTGTNSCSATGLLTCTGTNAASLTSGANYNQMQWATLRSVGNGWFAAILANMSGSSSSSTGPTGPEQYALNYAIFLTRGPSNGVVRWYDITEGKDGWFEDVSPATSIVSVVPNILGGGAGGSCHNFPFCDDTVTEYASDVTTETVPPYVLNAPDANRPATMGKFSYSYANASYSSIVSNWGGEDRLDLVQNSDGNWDFFFSCPDTSAHLQLCGAVINGTSGKTTYENFLESGFGVSNSPYTDITALVKGNGNLYVLASNGGANTPGCSHPCTNEYTSDHTMTSWSRTLLFGSAGTANNGNNWSSVNDPYGLHATKFTFGPDVTNSIGPACGGAGACRPYPMDFKP